MNGNNGYAVFFFPQALEALGEAIKPYLLDGPAGQHVMCNGVDTGGAFIELSLNGTTKDGTPVELELMVPTGMVRMIVSAHSDEMFGFGPHALKGAVQKVAPVAAEAAAAEGAGVQEKGVQEKGVEEKSVVVQGNVAAEQTDAAATGGAAERAQRNASDKLA
jgi:hypothetical protein